MIDDAKWQCNLSTAARELVEYLIADYRRQPHITLLPAGFPTVVEADIEKAIDIARRYSDFKVTLGSLTSFSSSPCYALDDGVADMHNLRRQLRGVMFDENSVVSDTDYRPHLTVGLYRDRFPAGELCDRIATIEAHATEPVRVTEFVLARYHTASIKGPIQVVARFELGSGRFTLIQDSGVTG